MNLSALLLYVKNVGQVPLILKDQEARAIFTRWESGEYRLKNVTHLKGVTDDNGATYSIWIEDIVGMMIVPQVPKAAGTTQRWNLSGGN